MTLHEAIRRVLMGAGRPLTASEIADHINGFELYTRKDRAPVPFAQIEARIASYSDEFYTENGKIFLVEYNHDKSIEEQLTLKCREIRNVLAHRPWFREDDFIEIILHFIVSKSRRHILQRDIKDVIYRKINHRMDRDVHPHEIERFVEHLELHHG